MASAVQLEYQVVLCITDRYFIDPLEDLRMPTI